MYNKSIIAQDKVLMRAIAFLFQISMIFAYMRIKESSSSDAIDIVNTEKYMKYSIDPHLTNVSQDIEYYYIESDLCDMDKFQNQYSLEFISNEQSDISKHTLKEMKYSDNDSCVYTVQIQYQCPQNKYLVNYSLLIQDKQDQINRWSINWRKICSENKIPRNDLNIDLQVGNKQSNRIQLVQNGVSVSNESIQLDKSAEKVQFIVYLQSTQSSSEEQEQDQTKIQSSENSDEANKDKDNLSILKNMVILNNEEIIQKPIIFFNEQEVNIKIKGNLSKGGVISKKGDFDQSIKDENIIQLEFECLEKGETSLELIIPLIHFDNIKANIVKVCGINIKEEVIQFQRRYGLELVFFIVFLLFTISHMIYSMLVKNQNVLQSYPFLLSIIHFLLQRQLIQRNQKWHDFLVNISRNQAKVDQNSTEQQDETIRLNQSTNFNTKQSYVNEQQSNYDDESCRKKNTIQQNNDNEQDLEREEITFDYPTI